MKKIRENHEHKRKFLRENYESKHKYFRKKKLQIQWNHIKRKTYLHISWRRSKIALKKNKLFDRREYMLDHKGGKKSYNDLNLMDETQIGSSWRWDAYKEKQKKNASGGATSFACCGETPLLQFILSIIFPYLLSLCITQSPDNFLKKWSKHSIR